MGMKGKGFFHESPSHSLHSRLFTYCCSGTPGLIPPAELPTIHSGTLFPQRTKFKSLLKSHLPNEAYAAHSFKNIPHSLSYY